MLIARLCTALVALLVFLAALFYLPQIGWALFLMPWLLIGAWEWTTLVKWPLAARIIYLLVAGALCGVLWIVVVMPVDVDAGILVHAIALGFWLLVAPLWLAQGWRARHPLPLALTGMVLLLPLWLALVQLQGEPRLLLILLIIIWISDSAAFLCGKRWGRRKLAPAISPGKTREGVAGAMAAVTLYYVFLPADFITGHAVLNGAAGLAVFLALTVLGVEGDLFESWIKRSANVKDSGTVLPGHGGILDRVDALTSSMPVAALMLAWFA